MKHEVPPHTFIDPVEVAQYVSAVARGFTSSGIAPTAKHFPGHGDTHVDSHVALPRISKTKEELAKTELIPFKEVLQGANPISCIMTGHMALPVFNGNDTPASLSAKVTKELLRGEMGFRGVVVTDCLEMDAVAEPLQGGCGAEEGAVRALVAGADIVMTCHSFDRHVGSMKSVYKAVEEGRLSSDELRESGERVKHMKNLFAGSWNDVLGEGDPDTEFEGIWKVLKRANLALSGKAYQRSCRVFWGSDMLPLNVSEQQEVLLFTPQIESLNPAVDDAEEMLRHRSGHLRNAAGAAYLSLANKVRALAKVRHIVYSSEGGDSEETMEGVGAVIFVLRNADRGVWQKELMRKVIGRCKGAPVVLLSSCGPYDLIGEEDELRGKTAYIGTFEFTAEAFEGFIKVVMPI